MTSAELFEHLRTEALKLGADERRELARVLEDSLSEDFDLHPAWHDELSRRIDAVDNGTAKTRPAADVLAEIRARFGW